MSAGYSRHGHYSSNCPLSNPDEQASKIYQAFNSHTSDGGNPAISRR